MSVVERYLARLGIERPATKDVAALKYILEAHLRAIPFEDVTSFLGSPVSLVPEEVFAKLLEGGRGGYCMEHCLMTRTALAELGFDVEPVLARVYFGPDSDKPMAQTHAVTAVTLDGQRYIFDPGFGAYTPSIPVCISSGEEKQSGQWGTYRVRPAAVARDDVGAHKLGADVTLVVESYYNGAWTPLYGLTRPPVVLADIDAFNWFVSTSPNSFFTRKLMCARWDGDNRVTAFDKAFKKRTADGVKEVEMKSLEDVDHWLRQEMGLNLSDEQIAAAWKRLNAQ